MLDQTHLSVYKVENVSLILKILCFKLQKLSDNPPTEYSKFLAAQNILYFLTTYI